MKRILVPPDEINNQTVRAFFIDIANEFNKRLGNIPDDSTAADVATVVEDLNSLLDVLR